MARSNAPAGTNANDFVALQKTVATSDYFHEQVRFLCNSIGPRLSGSPQAAAAVEYVSAQMRGLGLNVKLEPVTVPHWVRGDEEAYLTRYPGQARGTTQGIVVTALGNTPATPLDGLNAPVLVVSDFHEFDRLTTQQISGKIVLFNFPFDEAVASAGHAEEAYESAVIYRSEGPARAAAKGAVATLVRSVGFGGSRLAHTGNTRFPDGTRSIAAGAVTTEDADLIAALSAEGPVELHLKLTPRDLPPEQSYNVIADLRGAEHPDEIVIVSGHLDSWDLGTGALDDAAGLAVAMDVIRLIKQMNPHPARTVRFVAWMNEENGVAGGRAYAEAHRQELANHVAAIELDYGDGRPLGLKVQATEQRFEPISSALHSIGDPAGGVIRVESSPAVDIGPINRLGVPAIAPLQDTRRYFRYHHTAADTFEKVNFEELRQNLALVTGLANALAEAR